MRRIPFALAASIALLGAARLGHAKEAPTVDTPLPVDERYAVRETLPTGLRLYVRRHELPKGQVGLWLHVGTGSINEMDNERGVAHYLEHVAFRGSTHFPPGTVTERFEELGVRFGRDQNAMTSFDQTTYQINLPRTDPASIAEGLFFLSDVAFRLALVPAEINDERGVVLEEARARASAQMRIMERLLPLIAPGSRAAERLPIGIPEVVEAIDAPTMRGFYERWYRPEASTLMIIGDIDPETVAAMAKLAFADWRPTTPATPPADAGLRSSGARRHAVLTDPEVTSADLTWLRAEATPPSKTVADYRTQVIESLGAWIMSHRLDERERQGTASYQDASLGTQAMIAGTQLRMLGMQAAPERWQAGARELLIEWRRLQQHGVLPAELEQAKKAQIASLEQAVEAAAGAPTVGLLMQLNGLVTQGREPMSEAQRLDVTRAILPTITCADVTADLRQGFDLEGGLLFLTLPAKAAIGVPQESELQALVDEVLAMEVEPPTSKDAVDRLVAPPAPGAVTAESVHEGLGVTRIDYANGITALIRPVPTAGQAMVSIRLHGGICDETAADRGITALTVDALAGDGRASATHDASAIAAYLVGKKVSVGLSRQGASVVASVGGPADALDTGLELAHLLLTEGRITADALAKAREGLLQELEDGEHNAQQQAFVRVRQRMGGEDARLKVPTAESVNAVTLEAAQAWWQRLAARTAIEVVVSGAIEVERAKALLGTWVATLPARPEGAWAAYEAARTFPRRLAPGGENMRVATITPTAAALQGWMGMDRDDPIAMAHAQHAAMILTTRLLKEVRETRGLTYSIQAFPLVGDFRGLEMFASYFTADKDKLEEAAQIAKATAEGLRDAGPTEAEVAAINTQMQRGMALQKQMPQFWMGVLGGTVLLKNGLDDVERGVEALEQVDVAGVRAFLAGLLKDENYVHVLARPYVPDTSVKPETDKGGE